MCQNNAPHFQQTHNCRQDCRVQEPEFFTYSSNSRREHTIQNVTTFMHTRSLTWASTAKALQSKRLKCANQAKIRYEANDVTNLLLVSLSNSNPLKSSKQTSSVMISIGKFEESVSIKVNRKGMLKILARLSVSREVQNLSNSYTWRLSLLTMSCQKYFSNHFTSSNGEIALHQIQKSKKPGTIS